MLHTDSPKPCDVRPERWFIEEPKKIAKAKALCLTCNQRLHCLAETLDVEVVLGMQLRGVHGGLTGPERTKLTMKRIA